MHEDVAELYWTFVPSGFEDKIKNIAIKVNLPNKDNSNLFRAWAHGNLSGNVSLEDGYIEEDEMLEDEESDELFEEIDDEDDESIFDSNDDDIIE